MTDVSQIHRRAEQLITAAGSAALSIVHLDAALTHAREANALPAVISNLENARDSITAAINRAETHRRRLLRKADRKEHSA
jgi:hypothetical protein